MCRNEYPENVREAARQLSLRGEGTTETRQSNPQLLGEAVRRDRALSRTKKPSLSSPRPFDLTLRHDLAIRARKQPQRLAEGAIVCISTFFPARYHFDKFYGRMARLCDKREVPFLLHFQGLTQVDVCVEQNVVVLEPHTEKNS